MAQETSDFISRHRSTGALDKLHTALFYEDWTTNESLEFYSERISHLEFIAAKICLARTLI